MTDTRLLKGHTSLDLALYYCQRSRFNPFTEFAFITDVVTPAQAQENLISMLTERKRLRHRVTANDRWTAFFHTAYLERGSSRTLVMACRDKVDAMMFRMEWPHGHTS